MKKKKYIILPILSILALSSCQIQLNTTIENTCKETAKEIGHANNALDNDKTSLTTNKDTKDIDDKNTENTETIKEGAKENNKENKDNSKYLVVFYVDSKPYISEEVSKNSKASYKEAPLKDGYYFKGWSLTSGKKDFYNFDNEINSSLNLYAIYEKAISVNYSFKGYNEGAYCSWDENDLSNVKVEYKEKNGNFKQIDKELIRLSNGVARADILGLKKGYYDIKITKSDGDVLNINDVKVDSYNRDGYAHFKSKDDLTNVDVSKGIGAYDNNGVLKNNAHVIYVTEENKNSVTLTENNHTYKGLVNILKAKLSNPLDVRFIGTIGCATWHTKYYDSDPYKDGLYDKNKVKIASTIEGTDKILKTGLNTRDTSRFSEIDNINNRLVCDTKKKEYDSYWNMIDISDASNVTLEGVGTDAVLESFGFTYKRAKSVEVRNLTFDKYTEDACSFEADDKTAKSISEFTTGHIWVHHNTFNEGVNSWDVCSEQDKHDGDGSTDFKGLAFVSISYNHYVKTHKTGLIGGADSHTSASITFDHNFYDNCKARLPLGRQANMHMYNNYYLGSTGYSMSLRGDAYAFVENCYFEKGNTPIEVKKGAAKVCGCVFDGIDDEKITVKASQRDQIVQNNNQFCQDFDTNSDYFYYDNINKRTAVSNLTSAEEAKKECIEFAGVLK